MFQRGVPTTVKSFFAYLRHEHAVGRLDTPSAKVVEEHAAAFVEYLRVTGASPAAVMSLQNLRTHIGVRPDLDGRVARDIDIALRRTDSIAPDLFAPQSREAERIIIRATRTAGDLFDFVQVGRHPNFLRLAPVRQLRSSVKLVLQAAYGENWRQPRLVDVDLELLPWTTDLQSSTRMKHNHRKNFKAVVDAFDSRYPEVQLTGRSMRVEPTAAGILATIERARRQGLLPDGDARWMRISSALVLTSTLGEGWEKIDTRTLDVHRLIGDFAVIDAGHQPQRTAAAFRRALGVFTSAHPEWMKIGAAYELRSTGQGLIDFCDFQADTGALAHGTANNRKIAVGSVLSYALGDAWRMADLSHVNVFALGEEVRPGLTPDIARKYSRAFRDTVHSAAAQFPGVLKAVNVIPGRSRAGDLINTVNYWGVRQHGKLLRVSATSSAAARLLEAVHGGSWREVPLTSVERPAIVDAAKQVANGDQLQANLLVGNYDRAVHIFHQVHSMADGRDSTMRIA